MVFLSGDKTQEEYDEYYGEMPWVALPKGADQLRPLAEKFKVKGVPRLIILKNDGTVLNNDAIKKITSDGPQAIEEWLE